jgi:hypothetical protein
MYEARSEAGSAQISRRSGAAPLQYVLRYGPIRLVRHEPAWDRRHPACTDMRLLPISRRSGAAPLQLNRRIIFATVLLDRPDCRDASPCARDSRPQPRIGIASDLQAQRCRATTISVSIILLIWFQSAVRNSYFRPFTSVRSASLVGIPS